MGDPRERVVFGIVGNLSVPFLLDNLFLDRFVKGTFAPERKIVPYNSKAVSTLAIKYLLEEAKNKDKQ